MAPEGNGLLPQVYDIPKEFGSGLALLGLSWLGRRSTCTTKVAGGRPVVYLHGTGARAGSLAPLRWYQAALGHGAGFVFDYDTTPDIDAAAFNLAEYLDGVARRARSAPGDPLTLIGHSLGGLIIRRYLQLFPKHHPVQRVFLLSTPNYGTHLAHYFPTEVTTMMLPGSDFLAKLNDGSHLQDGVQYVSMYGDSDLFVLPRESMHLQGSEPVIFPGVGHNNVVLSPSVMAEIGARLVPGFEARLASGTDFRPWRKEPARA